MKIKKVVLSKSYTGFYFDDQKAIKAGAGHDGFMYIGQPMTEKFSKVRQTGEAISIKFFKSDISKDYSLESTNINGVSEENEKIYKIIITESE